MDSHEEVALLLRVQARSRGGGGPSREPRRDQEGVVDPQESPEEIKRGWWTLKRAHKRSRGGGGPSREPRRDQEGVVDPQESPEEMKRGWWTLKRAQRR